jgi:hypothetical protein
MKLWAIFPIALLSNIAYIGCNNQKSVEEVNSEANDLFNELRAGFEGADFGPDSKTDAFWKDIDPCHVLHDIYEFSDDFTRLGFFFGVEGEGVLGIGEVVGGYDVVFDLYNRQMSVSKYLGRGVSTPELSASIEFYAGMALGFENSVSEWNGHFASVEMEISLPLLKNFVSADPRFFISAEDENENQSIEFNELIYPPNGIYGYSLSISLGVNAIPEVLPVGGSATTGQWTTHQKGLRLFYDLLSNVGILGYSLKVHLIDHETGEACPENWPEEGGEIDCIIEFGDEDMSNIKAALHMAWGICALNGGCLNSLHGRVALLSIAIGAYQEAGNKLDEMCPDLVD